MAKDWKQATSGDVIKLEEGQRIEGKFNGIEVSALYPDSFALRIEQKDGLKTVFVNSIVRDLLDQNKIMSGQEIALLFKGYKKNQAGTHEYKDYELFYV